MLGSQSAVVFCFVLRGRSTVQFFVFVNFSNVHVFLCSVIEVLFSFSVFVNFSNVDVCFMFRRRSAVQFFLYLSILAIFFVANVSILASFFVAF